MRVFESARYLVLAHALIADEQQMVAEAPVAQQLAERIRRLKVRRRQRDEHVRALVDVVRTQPVLGRMHVVHIEEHLQARAQLTKALLDDTHGVRARPPPMRQAEV